MIQIATISNNKFVILKKYPILTEKTPIFTSLNQSFILVAKKVLMQSNINLILIKYYKKKPKF